MISNNLYTDIARTYSKWTPGDNPFATTSDREYEWTFRPWKISCAGCGITVTATEKQLEADGWSLSPAGEFCSDCTK